MSHNLLNLRLLTKEHLHVHPHVLASYANKDFESAYAKARAQRKLVGLDKRESDLLHFLEELFTTEFDVLKQSA